MSYIPIIENARIAADAVTSNKVLDGTLTDADVNAANIDGLVGVASLRTLGFGAQQAMPGDTTLDEVGSAAASLDLGSNTITNLANGVGPQDAATVAQVSAAAAGYDPKQSALYTTTGNIALTGAGTQANGTWPVALTAGDRILVKNQTLPVENGIYDAAAGAWARSADFDGAPSNEVTNGAFVLIGADDGTSLVATGWVVTSPDPIVVNTDDIDWVQVSGPAVALAINDLTDVDTTGVVTNAGLRFNGTNWVDTDNIKLDDAGKTLSLSSDAYVWDNSTFLEVSHTSNKILLLPGSGSRTEIRRPHLRDIIREDFVAVAADTTVGVSRVLVDSSSGAITITLPVGADGDVIAVKRRGANIVTVEGGGGQLIDGSATFPINGDFEAFEFVRIGSQWQVF